MKIKRYLIIMAMIAAFLLTGCGAPEEQTTGDYHVEKPVYTIRAWPNGEVPYYFDESFDENEKETMRRWMTEIEEKTENVVAFVEMDANDFYVCHIVRSSDGNYARMGYSKGSHLHLQNFNKGTFKHEMFHVLGFEHEWKRPDRDQWIVFHEENLNPKYANNAKISHALLYDHENHVFDLESISLRSYGPCVYSKNGGVVFEGMWYQGNGNLSAVDADKVVEVYGESDE